MKLTVDNYICNNYFLGSRVSKLDNEIIETLHSQVAERIKLKLPCAHLYSYNVSSSGLYLNKKEYLQIVDYSVFDFALQFISALEYNQSDLARHTYFKLRRYISLSRYDYFHEKIYRDITSSIPFSDSSYHKEMIRMQEQEDEDKRKEYSEIIETLIRFFFLHEYTHFIFHHFKLERYPNLKHIVDVTVNDYINELKDNDEERRLGADIYFSAYRNYPEYNDISFSDEALSLTYLERGKKGIHSFDADMESIISEKEALLNSFYDKSLADKYYKMYISNADVIEELICDNQSIMLLLELVQHGHKVENIAKAALGLMFAQFAISLAKSIPNGKHGLDIVHFRMGVLMQFVKNLGDEQFAERVMNILNTSNRYNNIQNLQCEVINARKYNKYLAVLLNIHSFDERKIFKSESSYSITAPVDTLPTCKNFVFSPYYQGIMPW